MQFLSMVVFYLYIHQYVIDGIVQRKFKKRFQFQFYKKVQSVLFGGDAGGSGGGSQSDEAYV